MRDLEPGSQVAQRYRLKQRLGRSAQASTWRATDNVTGADVALKIDADGDTARLRSEWQTAIRLTHAHVARVFEFHGDGDVACYGQQFIDGPDLTVLNGAPAAHVLPVIALVADALAYVHGRGIVHRDLKAANVLLDRNGAPYLIDFSAAMAIGDAPAGGSLIAASPQSLAGEPVASADDVFALGTLAWELLTGAPPWSSATTADDIRAAAPLRPRRPDGESLPDPVEQLLLAMLEADAARRPDAAAVAASIEAAGYPRAVAPRDYLGDRKRAATDEVIERADHTRRQRPRTEMAPAVKRSPMRAVYAGLAVLVILLVIVVFYLPTLVQERSVADLADTPAATPVATPGTADEAQAGDDEAPGVLFNENREDFSGRDSRVRDRAATEEILGELLSYMTTLEGRAVARWGGLRFEQARDIYEAGDEAYLRSDYATAAANYERAIELLEPLLDEVDQVFASTLADAQAALGAADTAEALRLFDLAVAMSPSNATAVEGLERARNLDDVLRLVDEGTGLEKQLELEAARERFARAVEIDPQWQPAVDGLGRVEAAIVERDFALRMSDGFDALAAGDLASARVAFRRAQSLKPGSAEPADGLLQVRQRSQLLGIGRLERQAQDEEAGEAWQAAVETYTEILELDPNLVFAQQGLARARSMVALHEQLDEYIAEPDSLSQSATMQAATGLVVDITRMDSIGPRLADQRDELSRLLKRAATPVTVELRSDNATSVSVYKVGRLGQFDRRTLELRPGTYVAVGSRPGYRDVRLEFQVGPEIDADPVVIRCEEPI